MVLVGGLGDVHMFFVGFTYIYDKFKLNVGTVDIPCMEHLSLLI